MNREDIMRMAREAGFEHIAEADYWHPLFERFARAAYAAGAAAEREACKRRNETKERIRKLAEQAGIDDVLVPRNVIEKFAALVATDENEACLKIAENELNNTKILTGYVQTSSAARNIVDGIRARGEK